AKINLAEASVGDELFRGKQRAGKTRLASKKINAFLLRRLFLQHAHFRDIECRRLFAKNVFARAERGEGDGKMEKIRQTNERRVERGIGEHFGVIDECLF